VLDLPSIRELTTLIPPLLLALTLHEYAHGWIADRFGDPTARLQGRLTLNPLPHLDPVGALAFILFKFGWAKPVPVNASNFRNPLRDMMWVAAAGPAANLLLATASSMVLQVIPWMSFPATASWLVVPLYQMLAQSVWLNVILAIFNFVPIPPWMGAACWWGFCPLGNGFIILIVLIYTGIVGRVILPVVSLVAGFLLGA
jgi:Zn-dependent protease